MRDNEELRKQREERRLEKRARERSQSPAWGESLPGAKRGERNVTGGDHKSKIKSEPIKKEKPNFETSGKLTEDSNTFRGVVIKYNEPPEENKSVTGDCISSKELQLCPSFQYIARVHIFWVAITGLLTFPLIIRLAANSMLSCSIG